MNVLITQEKMVVLKERGLTPTKFFFAALIILLGCIILRAFDVPLGLASTTSADPSPMEVTPIDTSAGTLIVTMLIDEDQDATDGMSNITLSFRTHVIEENNFARFDDQEQVTCNGVTLKLHDLPSYTLKVKVAPGGYTCTYKGNASRVGQLAAVQMISVRARSNLSPQHPSVNSQGYKISYTPDAKAGCSIIAKAIDGSGKAVTGGSEPSTEGMYKGPDTSVLNGTGEILLTRTCSPKLSSPFSSLNFTYRSTANVEVTWSH